MTNRKSLKQQITETVLNEIPKQYRNDDLTIDDLIFKWWMTGRQEGLRLTPEGVVAFQLAEIAYYDYEFTQQEDQSWHSFLLEVNRKIKCPYFLGVRKPEKKKEPYIRFYDSRIAMMVSLYGNLKGYLDSIK